MQRIGRHGAPPGHGPAAQPCVHPSYTFPRHAPISVLYPIFPYKTAIQWTKNANLQCQSVDATDLQRSHACIQVILLRPEKTSMHTI